MEDNNLEISLQICASLLHETAHAIIRYLEDNYEGRFDMELSPTREEEICEEFSQFHMRKWTGCARSELEDKIRDMFGENELKTTDSK